jgi:hypothetical protein
VRAATVGVVALVAGGFFVWLMGGEDFGIWGPVVGGIGAVVLAGAGVFVAYLLYLSPRRMCAGKQRQLEEERRQFAAALEKERESVQQVLEECDVLKSKLGERPLRPVELRSEIDQLIAEGELLLESANGTLVGEADMWFDDVERFAKRHLSSSQYDQLHAASPPDLAKQVEQSRGVTKEHPIDEEEFAVAERLVKINAGLRELRQRIDG